MKGRPFTVEKFEQMLQTVEKTLKPRQHASVRFLLNGLWLSGLRLGEALSLTWDQWQEHAQVKVDEKAPKEKGNPRVPVWASAHDLRRAFGFRWSRKVNSMVLKELMRHASVTTTEQFYVGIQANETAAMLAGLMPPETTKLVVELVVDEKRVPE